MPGKKFYQKMIEKGVSFERIKQCETLGELQELAESILNQEGVKNA